MYKAIWVAHMYVCRICLLRYSLLREEGLILPYMSASSALYVCLIQGWRGFMRGVGARILYQAPGAACCWVAYEYMKHSLASPIFGDFFLEEHEDDDDHGGGGGRGLSRHASHGEPLTVSNCRVTVHWSRHRGTKRWGALASGSKSELRQQDELPVPVSLVQNRK